MRSSKKKPKVRIERRRLKDGTIKTYVYDKVEVRKPANTVTVGYLLAQWQRSLEWEALKPGSKQLYTTYIRHLYDAFREQDIKSIERGHLLSIRDILAKNSGHAAATIFCRASSVFFKWCIEHNKLSASPAGNMTKPLTIGHLKTWTLEQALKAEAELPFPYNRVVYLARHTAQRRGDLVKMRWSDYDGQQIKVTQEKTGTSLTVPVTGEFKVTLDQWKKEANGLMILTQKDGTPISSNTLTSFFARTLPKLGFPRGLNVHGLRKLAAVTAAEAGCSTHEIASLTGHKSLALVQLYTKDVDQQKLSEAAVLRIEDFIDKRAQAASSGSGLQKHKTHKN